jgi:hypothetical protein
LNGGRKVNWARVITTLVIQLAARVGKSRATPICPFLYYLYERKELLKPEEEKSWKIQEGMLKYGESGSEDEGGSGSGSEDESDDEEEEEEETQVLLNRPPKWPRQEDKSEQIGATLVLKVEGLSLSSSKDRFHSICNALGEMQVEHDRTAELLKEAYLLAVCAPSELPDRIQKMMVDQARVEDSRKLREENARLNLEVGNLINENRAAWTQAEAAAERIRVMTSVSKGESGSEREEVPIPDLDQRMGQEALSPDQESAGFLTRRMNK